jgi:putative DNA primase/helicase
MHIPLSERAAGRWRGILPALGIPPSFLSGKHGPCPVCGEGKDRFRFDNKEGRGTWICSRCGAGDGIELVKRVRGLEFKDAAREIERVIGGAPVEPVHKVQTAREQRHSLNAVWGASRPIRSGDPVDRWLTARGISARPTCLRTVDRLLHKETLTYWPAMVARVTAPDGRPATLHRTYLTEDGQKAPVPEPRLLMPGHVPTGSAIRLTEAGPIMASAEGIETAMAVSLLFDVPCWSTVCAGMMEKWEPPPEAHHILACGDNDLNFTGQAAAYVLANRVYSKERKRSAEVRIPPNPNTDWNDVLMGDRVEALS